MEKFINSRYFLVICLLTILVLGLLHLSYPFFGDQAFFLLGAREMDQGMVLYRDFWDLKQPGIFIFYLAGGKLFGFNEVGIHFFELIYWLSFSIILALFLRKYIFDKRVYLAYMAPVFIVGNYYLCSYAVKLTQVEILVIFPFMLVLIANTIYFYSTRHKIFWLWLSGIAGGLVLFYKIIFLPILLVFWLVLLIKVILRENHYWKSIGSFFIIPIGILFVWLPFIYYCYHHHVGSLCLNTFFVFPRKILNQVQPQLWISLFVSMKSFFLKIVFFLPFTFAGMALVRKKMLSLEMTLWFFMASIVIFIQRTSWYSYHFQLLFPPIVILALIAIDNLMDRKLLQTFLENKQLKAFVMVMFFLGLNLPGLIFESIKLKPLIANRMAITKADRLNYVLTDSSNYAAYRIALPLIDKKDQHCPIFVVNDPLVYYYADRNQAISQSGWSLQLFIPEMYRITLNELKTKLPCYIFIKEEFSWFLLDNGAPIKEWIGQNYTIYRADGYGTWYSKKQKM